MKRSSVSTRRLCAALVGASLTLHLSCSKAIAAPHLGNTTYLIRLMNFGGVSAGLVALPYGDNITTDYILGPWSRPAQVGPSTEVRCVTVWVEPVSGLLLLNCQMQIIISKCAARLNTNCYPKLQILFCKVRPIELNMIDCYTGRI